MTEIKNFWPSEEELKKSNSKINLAPYGVISEYSELIFDSYNSKLFGIILTKAKTKSNGDRTEFVYSLVISQTKDNGVQIKIFEIDIEDDGWYPAKIYLTKPYREKIGIAENEEQLRKFIEQGIKSDFVKSQIRILLND